MQAADRESSNDKSTGRHYIYTIFEESFCNEYRQRIEFLFGGGAIRYIIGQLERCPESGRRHVQLYVNFKRAQRGRSLFTAAGLPHGAGWSAFYLSVCYMVAKRERFRKCTYGKPEAYSAYCSKEETRIGEPVVFGDLITGGQGSRSDLHAVAEQIREGASLKEVAKSDPITFIKFSKGISSLQSALFCPSATFQAKKIIVCIGATGVGKTRYAYTKYGDKLWRSPSQDFKSPWFDGYSGESVALFDDYGLTNKLPWGMCLQVTDGYEMWVPCKGGFKLWKPEVIIITSNFEVDAWYPEIIDRSPLFRRITKIKRM